MKAIIFTEEFCQPDQLHPFTLTKQVHNLRIGILTIREKWENMLKMSSMEGRENSYKDSPSSVELKDAAEGRDCLLIHGNLLPTREIVKAAMKLKNGEFISAKEKSGVIFRFGSKEVASRHKILMKRARPLSARFRFLHFPWDIIQLNDWAIREDYALLTRKRTSQKISKTNKVINPSSIFIEKGAVVEHAIINASEGPVYIGRDALVMEGTMIRGPVAICEGAVIKMGTKIYGATTIGPYSTAGGEIKNSVIMGYSNKAHDGYLGDSVIGEWCNLGAGTTNSNLKNNLGEVRVWTSSGEHGAGMKCGVMMGDYSKTAINTSINTGTVIGPGCNVFGAGLTPKYIPPFSWGTEGIKRYELPKLLKDIGAWKKLKNQELEEHEKNILTYIFEHY